jgi:hypothetical protein
MDLITIIGDAKHQQIIASYRDIWKMAHLDIFSMQPRKLSAHTLYISPLTRHRGVLRRRMMGDQREDAILAA